jgi:hypothetical protein
LAAFLDHSLKLPFSLLPYLLVVVFWERKKRERERERERER